MTAFGASASSASPASQPSAGTVVAAKGAIATSSAQPPIMDAFGNPLELPAHISPYRVFKLLDQVLPFEICLYHRVLPLSEVGNQLQLGMVDPHDEQALDYVRRIVAYRDRGLTPVPLAGHLHQVLLSAYLNHASQQAGEQEAEGQGAALIDGAKASEQAEQQPGKSQPSAIASKRDAILETLSNDDTLPEGGELETRRSQATQPEADLSESERSKASQSPPASPPQSPAAPQSPAVPQSLEEWELETLFPSETASRELQELGIQDFSSPATKNALSTLDIEQPTYLETQPAQKTASATRQQLKPAVAISQRRTLVLDETEILAELAQAEAEPKTETVSEPPTLLEGVTFQRLSKGAAQDDGSQLPTRQDLVQNLAQNRVEEVPSSGDRSALPASLDALPNGELSQRNWVGIAHLPPSLLLQAMLGRMLQGNITRLRMERCRRPQSQSDLSQLFWNPAGVLQPAWNEFSLGAFAGLAKALRELAQLPLGPIQQPIQRGVMRRYQGKPILLLMQFMPGTKVAAIELRLLRNQALRSFQQRQGKDLGREALLSAQQLQYQVQQLLDHHQRYPEAGAVPEPLVAVIQQLAKSIAGAT